MENDEGKKKRLLSEISELVDAIEVHYGEIEELQEIVAELECEIQDLEREQV